MLSDNGGKETNSVRITITEPRVQVQRPGPVRACASLRKAVGKTNASDARGPRVCGIERRVH
eukprot:3299252-Prymnesium_polylepis.1